MLSGSFIFPSMDYSQACTHKGSIFGGMFLYVFPCILHENKIYGAGTC